MPENCPELFATPNQILGSSRVVENTRISVVNKYYFYLQFIINYSRPENVFFLSNLKKITESAKIIYMPVLVLDM